MPVLERRPEGLYCPSGNFYIDPWKPVDRAIITHGHSDHARWGMGHYLCTKQSEPILRLRLGDDIKIQAVDYGESIHIDGATLSLHPAGHITGSAQVRIDVNGEVWVVSGDYKTEPDKISTPFELIKCHGFVTETTFGLPVYRWESEPATMAEIDRWWALNQEQGKASVLFGYALGKAQRILAGVDRAIGPIYVHGAVASVNEACRQAGIDLPECKPVSEAPAGTDWSKTLIIAPPSANGTPWMRRFKDVSTGFASGWMAIRGARRRRSVDRGFVLSDHVDWPSLMQTVSATGAECVWTTHGYADIVARYLTEQGLSSRSIATEFVGETSDASQTPEEDPTDA
jgi:putative mRNA 3-end processing factor